MVDEIYYAILHTNLISNSYKWKTVVNQLFMAKMLEHFKQGCQHEGSATARLGVQDFEIHWISSGFRISEWISGFQSGFLDFKVDFWISKRISGFQSGFLEGFLDFKRISGFQSGFLDFKVDFSRDFWI